MLVEILPMGALNHLFGNLADNSLKKKIAGRFSLSAPVFGSWLTVLILTRNACCHHARIWNKKNSIPPAEPRKMKRPWIMLPTNVNRIYYNLCILKYFADCISPQNNMKQHLLQLLADYPMVDTQAMGFPPLWQSEPLWR